MGGEIERGVEIAALYIKLGKLLSYMACYSKFGFSLEVKKNWWHV